MSEPVFVDTNVWTYAVDGADPARRQRALGVTAPTRDRDIVISTQVLTEFYAVITRKLSVPVGAEAAEAMVRELGMLPVVAVDVSLVQAAVAGSRLWQISIWDALIFRAAEAAACRRILSEDLQDGTTCGSVVVENPFASGGARPAPEFAAQPPASRSISPTTRSSSAIRSAGAAGFAWNAVTSER